MPTKTRPRSSDTTSHKQRVLEPDAEATRPSWAVAGLPKPKLSPGTNYCQCSGCREYFVSPRHFERHRVELRCRTPEEMRAAGMVTNERGYWVHRPSGHTPPA